MPPPLRDMLPLAAAATECRLTGLGTIKRRANQSKRRPCTVRVHGHLAVVYGLLELGGSSRTSRPLHLLQAQYDEDAPRSFDRTFLLDDPRTFFRSRSACRDEIHRMLTRTPALRDFDLAAANWDGGFLPDDLAGTITEWARLGEEEHGGDAPRFSLELSLTVFVRAVCSEAKLLALACREATAQCGLSAADRCCCCICQDQDIAAAEGGGDDDGTVRLPCSHTFHVRCLARWFEKVTTCPLCRRDMVVHLEAVYTHESKAVTEKLKALYKYKIEP